MDLNRLISYSLRIGVLVSSFLAAAGLVAWSLRGFADLGSISGREIGNTIASAFVANPSGLIYLGIAVLVATPVFRVALSTLYFAHDGDNRYVLITLIVLSMLIFALLSGSSG
jgi:uncharacterized membrane protein